MLITTDLRFDDISQSQMNVISNDWQHVYILKLEEVISLRNFLTKEINRVQQPIAEKLKGNANVTRT